AGEDVRAVPAPKRKADGRSLGARPRWLGLAPAVGPKTGKVFSALRRRETGHDLLREEAHRGERLSMGHRVEVDLQGGVLEPAELVLQSRDRRRDIPGRTDPGAARRDLLRRIGSPQRGDDLEIGRASCRERGWMAGCAVAL